MKTRVLYTCREYAQYIPQAGSPRITPIRDRWYEETLANYYVILDQVRPGVEFSIEIGPYAYSLWKGAVW